MSYDEMELDMMTGMRLMSRDINRYLQMGVNEEFDTYEVEVTDEEVAEVATE